VKGQRKARDTEREIRKELIDQWGERPVTSIAREDVIWLIEAIAKRPAPYTAQIAPGSCQIIVNWAINRGTYGLETSRCDRIKPSALIGAKQPRQRVRELAACRGGSETLGYPFGPLYKLVLTGARKNEVAGAQWSEFDLKKRIWTIPLERFKSNASHLVPLSDAAVAIIKSLPHFTKGDTSSRQPMARNLSAVSAKLKRGSTNL
jgi:integrase